MPTFNDITAVADAMAKCRIKVLKDACVRGRNRKVTCRRCEKACPRGAIEVVGDEVTISSALCVECGACVGACPTEAIVSLAPASADLAEAAIRSLSANDGVVVFACARIASKRLADPERYAEVPCLARLDESLLLLLVGRGATKLLLVDGTCPTCKFRDCVVTVDEVISQVDALLAAHGSSVRVERASAFHDDLTLDDARLQRGSSRRGFLSDATRAAKEAALSAAQVAVGQELGIKLDELELGDRLRGGEDGALPKIRMPRHECVIDALDAIGTPSVDVISSRLFGTVSLNARICNACGTCAALCPTGALRRDTPKRVGQAVRYLEFSASDCVQCGVCVDVCWKRTVKLSPDVPTDELYDFEPRVFEMYTRGQSGNPAW